MRELPLELLIQVLPFCVASQATEAGSDFMRSRERNRMLKACCLVHSSWSSIAKAELYSEVLITNDRAASKFLETMELSEECRHWASRCRTVKFGGYHWTRGREQRDRLLQIAERCPNVTTLRMLDTWLDLGSLSECFIALCHVGWCLMPVQRQ